MGKIKELINKIAAYNPEKIAPIAKRDLIDDLRRLRSSLPTQQPVEVPPCVDEFLSVGNKSQKLACLISCKYSILSCDLAEGELKQWLREISMSDLLSLANGYTVGKKALFTIPVPYMRDTLHYYLKDNGDISFKQGNAYKFNGDQIDKYFSRYQGVCCTSRGGITMTEKYRKKPVEVEVIKFDRDKWIKEESQANETYPMVVASIGSGFKTIPVIETLEGDMKVSDGDYIIKGVQGEFYPCKPDIFHETYEPVTDHQPTFVVGEYYSFIHSGKTEIFKVLSISDLENRMKVKSYRTNIDIFTEYETYTTGNAIAVTDSKPATAEQIAMFKRAEHFAEYGDKSVKKTLTIPKYLNALALENHINFSQLLQKALREELQEVENNE